MTADTKKALAELADEIAAWRRTIRAMKSLHTLLPTAQAISEHIEQYEEWMQEAINQRDEIMQAESE